MSTPSGKKDAILNAALKLFAEQGFHAAPMSQIAETADIGVGTIYRYYKNKEELIDDLYLEVRRRMAEEIIKGQDTSAPVKHEFNRSMKNLIRYLVMHPEEIQFSNQYEHSPFITDATRREVEKTVSPLADLLLRGRFDKFKIDNLSLLNDSKYYTKSISYHYKLISIEKWIKVVEKLRVNRQKRNEYRTKKASKDLATGIIKCSECGEKYYSHTHGNKTENKQYYYVYYKHYAPMGTTKCSQRSHLVLIISMRYLNCFIFIIICYLTILQNC